MKISIDEYLNYMIFGKAKLNKIKKVYINKDKNSKSNVNKKIKNFITIGIPYKRKFYSETFNMNVPLRTYWINEVEGLDIIDPNFSYEYPYTHKIIKYPNKLSIDHVVPWSILYKNNRNLSTTELMDMYYDFDNLILISASENSKKGAKMDYVPQYEINLFNNKVEIIKKRYNIK